MARQAAVDPEDYISVWDALVELAKSDHPPPPVLGYFKSSGVRWRNSGKNGEETVEIFTKDALRKRLVPNAR